MHPPRCGLNGFCRQPTLILWLDILGWFSPFPLPAQLFKTWNEASWESACLQILCFCGGMECRTELLLRIIIDELGPMKQPLLSLSLGIFQEAFGRVTTWQALRLLSEQLCEGHIASSLSWDRPHPAKLAVSDPRYVRSCTQLIQSISI